MATMAVCLSLYPYPQPDLPNTLSTYGWMYKGGRELRQAPHGIFVNVPQEKAGGELHRGVLGWRRTWEQTTGRIIWSIVVLDAPDFTSLQ